MHPFLYCILSLHLHAPELGSYGFQVHRPVHSWCLLAKPSNSHLRIAGKIWCHSRNVYIFAATPTEESDFDVVVYFLSHETAVQLRGAVLQLARKLYRQTSTPQSSIFETIDEVNLSSLVKVSDYQPRDSPNRDAFLFEEQDLSSWGSSATGKFSMQDLTHESIFNVEKYESTIHAAHLNARIKGTSQDSVGKLIPLPAAIHHLFDYNLNRMRKPLISLETLSSVDSLGQPVMHEGVVYQPVQLRVHFYSTWIRH